MEAKQTATILERIQDVYQDYPPAYWLLMAGTFIDRLCTNLIMPFLAIYVVQRFKAEFTQVGVEILGAGGGGAMAGEPRSFFHLARNSCRRAVHCSLVAIGPPLPLTSDDNVPVEVSYPGGALLYGLKNSSSLADGDTAGAGIACAEEDGVGVGQETKRLRQIGGGAAVLAEGSVSQDVHAEDEQRAAGFTGHGHDGLQDGSGRCHTRGPGDDREKGFVETRLTGAHLQLGPARHVIQAVSEGGKNPLVRQADGESHGHAQRHTEDRDQAGRDVPSQRAPSNPPRKPE